MHKKDLDRLASSIFHGSSELLGVLDPEGLVIEVNQTALEYIHGRAEHVVGKPLSQTPWWINREEREKLLAALERVRKGETVQFETIHRHARLGDRTIEFTLRPVFGKAGKLQFIVPEGRDITELRNKEKLLTQALKRETLGTLVGGMAHDFNNILGGLKGTSDLILLKLQNDKNLLARDIQSELLVIEKSTKRASELMHRLLSLARPAALKRELIDLRELAQRVVNGFTAEVEQCITVVIELPDCCPVIFGDVMQLEQAIHNVLVNAQHALTIMKPVGVAQGGDVRISLTREKEEYCLRVQDTGVGMDPAIVDKIFDPFFTTKAQGAGLGLAMVHSIVERHEGRVSVNTLLGRGSEFAIYLPVHHESPIHNSC